MRPLPNESEADFLARQAEDAKAAITQAATDLTRALAAGLDPRALAKQHPWATLAGAAVAGFAAAAMVVPTKEDQALKRLAAIERALMPERERHGGPADAAADGDIPENRGAKKFATGQTGFLGGLGRQVLEAVKPAIMSALTAGITAKASQPDQGQQQPPSPGEAGYQPYGAAAYADPRTGGPPPSDPSATI